MIWNYEWKITLTYGVKCHSFVRLSLFKQKIVFWMIIIEWASWSARHVITSQFLFYGFHWNPNPTCADRFIIDITEQSNKSTGFIRAWLTIVHETDGHLHNNICMCLLVWLHDICCQRKFNESPKINEAKISQISFDKQEFGKTRSHMININDRDDAKKTRHSFIILWLSVVSYFTMNFLLTKSRCGVGNLLFYISPPSRREKKHKIISIFIGCCLSRVESKYISWSALYRNSSVWCTIFTSFTFDWSFN